MTNTTDSNSLSDSLAPDTEQPLPLAEASLARIVEQLETVIHLLRKPDRDEAEHKNKERQAAEALGKTLSDYASGRRHE